jgi:hypothetical protein
MNPRKIYAFLDNGVTGSIGIIYPDGNYFWAPTPVKRCLDYQKTVSYLNRVDVATFNALLHNNISLKLKEFDECSTILGIERPMVNPTRFAATKSSLRALEASLIVIEALNIPYEYHDSKAWQTAMLPKGLEGSEALKEASLAVGKRLFPKAGCKKDADSLLAAEYLRRLDNRKL